MTTTKRSALQIVVLLVFSSILAVNQAFECFIRNGTDERQQNTTQCSEHMCFKFQCNARVVKGCGDCVLNNASIPNFACANGWRFCANCTDREKCNGDGISARGAAGVELAVFTCTLLDGLGPLGL